MGEIYISDEMIDGIVSKLQEHVEKYIDKKLEQTKRDIIIYFEKQDAFRRARERSAGERRSNAEGEIPKIRREVKSQAEVKVKPTMDVKKTSTVRPAEFPKLDSAAKNKSSILNADGTKRMTVKDLIKQRPIEQQRKEIDKVEIREVDEKVEPDIESKLSEKISENKVTRRSAEPEESFTLDLRGVFEEEIEEEKQKEEQEVFNELDRLFDSIYQKPRYRKSDIYSEEEIIKN